MSAITIICGPTASGKSALAVRIAEEKDGIIINADSMQLYGALPILTAQPGAEDLARAPHRLYGAIPAERKCSARIWRDLALAEIDAAFAAGKHPILVGGTGLYLKALTEGLSDMPDVPDHIRAAANARQAELGNPAFHMDLARRDPVMAGRLNPNDTQRLIRAWEVLEATGESLSAWQARPLQGPPAGWQFHVMILTPERAWLHQRCDQRFDLMLEGGAIDEVRAGMDIIPDDAPVTHALGYRPLAAWLRGETGRAEAVAAGKLETRQYAKRQDTWFRHQVKPGASIVELQRIP